MSKADKAYFAAAKSVSELSTHKIHHIGAVLVSSHHIVSSGYNLGGKSHPYQARIDRHYFGSDECMGPLHAETMALLPFINSRTSVRGCTMYVFRAHRDGTLALARPCPRCLALLRELGVRKIKYTIEQGGAAEYAEETIKRL